MSEQRFVKVAHVTCPNCQNRFQAQVEQVIDVKETPQAKSRVINGAINVGRCPHCQWQGSLNVPFLYHDPEKELALVFMPMQTAQGDMERQQAIGKLTREAMDTLPAEERKAYLLQPQVFLSQDNLIDKVLKAEGVTEEMMEKQQAKSDLLRRMLDTESEEALEAMIEANNEIIDEDTFTMLEMGMQSVASMGQEQALANMQRVYGKLTELTTVGQEVKKRSDILQKYQEEPSRETLLEGLIELDDEETRELLVRIGRPAMDYQFFQLFTSRINEAEDKETKQRLKDLRKEILQVRDAVDEEMQEALQARSEFLRDILTSETPEQTLRQRFEEVDQLFISVLMSNIEMARSEGSTEAVQALESLLAMITEIREEALPPAIRLLNHAMRAETDEQAIEILEKSRQVVSQEFVAILQNVSQRLEDSLNELKEEGEEAEESTEEEVAEVKEALDRLGVLRSKAEAMVKLA